MEVKLGHLSLVFLVYAICATQAQLTNGSDCSRVQTFYATEEVGSLISMKAGDTAGAKFCNSMEFTCCSPQAEFQMYKAGIKDLKRTLENGTKEMVMLLKKHGDRLHNFVLSLIDGAQRSLDTLFSDTYDTTYTDNQDVFTKFFNDLKEYYQSGFIDLTDIFDSLFSSLTKIAFKLYKYEINDDYAQCIADNMHLIQPFADQPKKLENQVARAFVAVRTYLQALEYGRVVIENMSEMHVTSADMKEYIGMTHCAKCAGYIVESPCQTFCENTMHSILCSLHGDFSDTWIDYVSAMNSLLARMKGPFNIDAAISPINVEISGCIMLLQGNEGPIANAVGRACGPLVKASGANNGSGLLFPHGFQLTGLSQLSPNLRLDQPNERTKRSARRSSTGRSKRKKNLRSAHRTRDVTLSKRVRPSNSGQVVPAKSRMDLESLISELHDAHKILKTYWHNAPNNMCAEEVKSASSNCWNGKSVIPTDTGTVENMKRCPPGVKAEPSFRGEVHNFKVFTSRLRQAYNGIDTAMPDREVYGESSSGDGSGDDESTEDEKSEATHTSSQKKPREGKNKNGGVNINSIPSEDKSKYVMSLEDWEVDILEDVLGRPIAREELLKDLKEIVLKHHPHLKQERQGEHKIKVAKLTENQINRLKEMLGIANEKSTSDGKIDKKMEKTKAPDQKDEKPVITPRNVVKTTSSAFHLQSCPTLLMVVAFLFINKSL